MNPHENRGKTAGKWGIPHCFVPELAPIRAISGVFRIARRGFSPTRVFRIGRPRIRYEVGHFRFRLLDDFGKIPARDAGKRG
jgi:hypothetical protein